MTAKAAARPPHSTLAFGFGGHVAFGELGTLAEEELLHLLFHNSLGVGIEGIEAIFVHHHFGVLDPELRSVLGNIFEDALAKLAFPRRAIESRQSPAELDAVHHARAGLDRFAGGGSWTAGFVGHRRSSRAVHF